MKRVSFVVGSVAVGLILAGCSAPATAPAPASAPAPMPSAVQKTPTLADAAPGAEVDKKALGDLLASGAKSMRTGHMEMTIKATAGGQGFTMTMKGDVDNTDPAKPRAAVAVDGPMKMDMVMDGETYYMMIPLLGKDWYTASKAELEKMGGSSIPNPEDQFSQARQIAEQAQKVVYVGEETVGGTSTKHYTFTVPLSAVSGTSVPASVAAQTVPYDVYLDAQGVVRKTAFSLTEPAMTGEVLLTKINEPVTITIPTGAKPFPNR